MTEDMTTDKAMDAATAAKVPALTIRRANAADISRIDDLLYQVAQVHHQGRPDLFKAGAKKYTDDELVGILADDETPVFAAFNDEGTLVGYAFCIFQQHPGSHVLTDIRTLYIDDLCVDERARGLHVGSALYRYVLDFARRSGCYNVTLNVWSCNPSAQAFYEHMGLTPYRIGMEQIL
ncbi:Histone acetyltransferase HPA2 and related acetyltransferase [Bifidobacterium sp. DSM 109959]|uniref:Histone acetyltransferase HPA2 and related acetyltransferase n=2 Tax=Bifidobacterium olomucense TaxID=2675324 RepID=A0A7Y0HWW7_9BIFI|nr:GNAT family N-acetyltransferase [Bifidobacterium sp. DSM 109959]NMM97354.1 Histone acetyltransferase HPA2 and related acetyltransferase [Bifidobacterium sp. DSM 109959]